MEEGEGGAGLFDGDELRFYDIDRKVQTKGR
jgi:hypothetical protein